MRLLHSDFHRESVARYEHLTGIRGAQLAFQRSFVNIKVEMSSDQPGSVCARGQLRNFFDRQVRHALARLAKRALGDQDICALEEARQRVIVSSITGVAERSSAAFNSDRKALEGVRCLDHRQGRVIAELNLLAGVHHSQIKWKLRFEDLGTKRHLQTVHHSIESAWSHNRERLLSICR